MASARKCPACISASGSSPREEAERRSPPLNTCPSSTCSLLVALDLRKLRVGQGRCEHLPGVWKLSRRSSTGSVGWCSGSSLLLGRLPFRASDSALFLRNKAKSMITFWGFFLLLFFELQPQSPPPGLRHAGERVINELCCSPIRCRRALNTVFKAGTMKSGLLLHTNTATFSL